MLSRITWDTTLGWIAVGTATLFSSLWAFWGVYESFHEGWYFSSLSENLALTSRYMGIMLVSMALSVVACGWRRTGSALYLLCGAAFCVWILMTRKVLTLIVVLGWLPVLLPAFAIGLLFWFGRPAPLTLAYKISIFLPLLVGLGFAVEPVTRIASRIDDGNRGARVVQGNGVSLVWAPEGPGWPNPDPHEKTWVKQWRGPTWEEAQKVCRYLTADGTSIASTPQDIWRLPTVEEAVRSMSRHGANCQGVWNASSGEASFATEPDKESPLWNPYSPIIYWWTSSEPSASRAYSVDFNGQVYSRNKDSNLGSQGFRAVKSVGPTSPPPEPPGIEKPRKPVRKTLDKLSLT